MPSVKFSIDSSGADRGAQQFTRAVDRVIEGARRAARAIEQMDRATRALGQQSAAAREADRITRQFQAQQRAVQPATAAMTAHALALRNIGSASVLAFGPLSGVGSRIIAMGSAAQRTGLLLGGAISGVTGLGVALATSVRNAAQFELAMVKVGKVTNASAIELAAQGDGLLKLSSAMGVSAVELATIEESAARLGIRGAQGLAAFAEQIAMLTRTTDLGAEQASTQLARFMNLTGSSAESVKGISSALVALGNNFAATEGQILEMSLELARGASAFDVGADKILALGASLAAVGERSERSATAMTQVLIGLTQAASGGENLDKFATVLGVTAERFQELTRQDIGAVFIDLLKALQTEGPQATAVLDELGIGSSRNFKVLLSQSQAIDEVARALGLVRGEFANATAAQREFELFNDSLIRKLETFGTNLTNVSIALGQPFLEPLKDLVDTGTAFLLVLQGIEQPASGVAAAMNTLGADVVIAARAFGTLYPLLKVTGELMGDLATADLGGLARGLMSIPERLREATSEASKLFADLEKLRTGQKVELFPDAARDAQVLAGAVRAVNGELTQSTTLPRTVADAVDALGQSQARVGFASTAFAEKLKAQGDAQKAAEKAAKGAATEAANYAEKIDRTGDALSATLGIYGLAASGAISLAEAEQRATAASAALMKGQDGLAATTAALAVERQKAAVELVKATAAQADANSASEAQIAILEGAVAAGTAYEDAQRQIAVAAIDREAAVRAATTGDVAAVEQWRAAQVAALGYADSVERLDAALRAQDETRDLQLELSLTKQVNEGLISQLEKKIAIARASADNNVALADELEQQVRIQDEIERQEAAYIRLGDTIRDSLGEVFDALIAGTLDFGDAAQSLGLAIGKRWVDGMLESKLRDFDPAVRANFLELGEFGEGTFGDLFSGAGDWLSGLFSGGSGSSVGSTGLQIIGQNADGSFIFSDGSSAWGQSVAEGGTAAGGFSWGGAGAGAIGGFGAASMLGGYVFKPGATGLNGLQRGAEPSILANGGTLNNVIGTIIGAILGGLGLGPLGGLVGGAISSGVGALVMDSIDRDALRNRRFSGGLAGGIEEMESWFGFFGQDGFSPAAMIFDMLGIPTLGTAFRRAGESIIDDSTIFGGEDGKGGLQALLGDFTRSGDSNRRGREIALERGLSSEQVDALMGGTGSIFSQLADGEIPADAGRFSEAMGRTMAEFLSRGLAEGMDYEQMLGSLRAFAEESGVTLQSSIANLPAVFAQSRAAALEFGKLSPFEADAQAAKAYATNLLGIAAIFQADMPAGVDLASVALRYFTRDGVNAFGELDNEAKDTLANLADDSSLLTETIEKLVAQGFEIDADAFQADLASIVQSAEFVGANLGALFTSEDVTQGIDALAGTLKGTINSAVQEIAIGQLFDKTRIAESFAPVFAVLDRAKAGEFNFLDPNGSALFNSEMLAAIAQGKANLAEWIPQIVAARKAMLEVEEAVDEALEPTPAEKFFTLLEQRSKDFTDAFRGAVLDAFEEGVAALRETGSIAAGVEAFSASLSTSIEDSLIQGITNAFVQGALLSASIGPMMAELEAKTQAAMQDGVITAAERAELTGLAQNIMTAGQNAVEQLKPLFEDLGHIVLQIDTSNVPTGGKTPGFASGGSIAHGSSFIVGERGPELVFTNAYGSTVVPIDYATMHAMLSGGLPGYADGTVPRGHGPIGGAPAKPNPLVRYGPGGVPKPRPSDDGDSVERELAVLVSFDYSNAIADFAAGGTAAELREALRRASGEGVLEGMQAALIEGLAFDEFNQRLSDATREAMRDGVIDATEAGELSAMAEEFAAGAEQAIVAMGPAFDVVAEAFGLRTGEVVETAITTATATAGELIGGTLRGALSDPATLNLETFTQSLRGSIYENVAGGLIDAFIESAVVNGALAAPLAAITGIFDQIGAKQLSVAEANGLIAEQMAAINGVLIDPTFTSSIETLLSGIGDIGKSLNAFPPAARAVESAATGVSDAVTDAEKDVCRGACGLQEQTIALGSTVLDGSGRAGEMSDIVWKEVPKFADGGIAMRPTFGIFGEAGPEALVPLDRLGTYDLAESAAGWLSTATAGAGHDVTALAGALDEIRRELHELRREAREDQRDRSREAERLRNAIGAQPVVVKSEFKVGTQKVIDVIQEAKRAARDSGQPL